MVNAKSHFTLQQFWDLLGISALISVIIFFSAVLSDFSVKMFYSSSDPSIKVIAGLIGIGLMTLLLMLLFLFIPKLREAFLKIFGMK